MKKLFCLLFAAVLLVLSAGCGSTGTTKTPQVSPAAGANPASPGALLTTTSPTSAATSASATASFAPTAPTTPTPSRVDVDLTKLTATMIYAELQNVMAEPKNYIGKVFKAKGPFGVYHDEENDNYFFAVIFQDATACCSQNLEFVWAGNHKYPDDYPALGTEIVVTGTFHDYMDGDLLLYHLENASMVLANA